MELAPLPSSVFYVGSPTMPAGMTVGQYRRSRPRRPSSWVHLKRRAGGASTRMTASP
jgi:hypothetical protein